MVANVSKKGNFVIGEMVIGPFLTNSSLQTVLMPTSFFIYISLWQEEELILTEIGVLTGE